MNGQIEIGTPNAKQNEFLRSTKRFVAFGGARGGGKSWAVQRKAILMATKHPGIRQVIVRKTYPELKENHINIMRMELAGVAKYNDKDKQISFPNGSVIKFDYCASDSDLTHWQGVEWDIIYVDEATNLTEYQLKVIGATNRGVNNFPKRIYYTCNPGGPGHAYIKRLFIDRVYEENENSDDYEFIQSLVWDNEILMKNNPDYIKMLQALPLEKRKGWLEGQWDIYEGLVFSEWRNSPEHYDDKEWTHVINPFDIPRDWKVFRCFDWGYSRPFACYWIAIAPNNQKFVIKEFYGCDGEPNKGVELQHMAVAEQIREIEDTDTNLKGRKISASYADPAIFSKDSHGTSIADDMLKPPNYILWLRGNNERINGKMQVHYHLAFDEGGQPMLQVFNTCRHLIRTLPNLLYDEKRLEDIDTDMEDHAYDAIRYGLQGYPIPARRNTVKPAEIPQDDPLNLFHDNDKVIKFNHF